MRRLFTTYQRVPPRTGVQKMNEKPETYFITFEMTSLTDPNKWDWDSLLDPTQEESYSIHSIGQITRNNKQTGEN